MNSLLGDRPVHVRFRRVESPVGGINVVKFNRLVFALTLGLTIAACQSAPFGADTGKGKIDPAGEGPSSANSGGTSQANPGPTAEPLKSSVLGIPVKTTVKEAVWRGGSKFEIVVKVADYKGLPLTGLERGYFAVYFGASKGSVDFFAEELDGSYRLGITAPDLQSMPLAASAVTVTVSDIFEAFPLAGIVPAPSFFFPSDAKLTGRFTFGGNSPPSVLTAQYKAAGGARTTVTATSDSGGYFYFKDVSPGDYQIIWDDGGEEVRTGDVNTVGIYVGDPVSSPPTQLATPQQTLDLKWAPRPVPAPGAEVTRGTATAFTFTGIANLDATYQISLFSLAKYAVGPATATGSTSPISIDTSALAAGSYYYMIKFFKKGGTFGGRNFYGMTKYIAFALK